MWTSQCRWISSLWCILKFLKIGRWNSSFCLSACLKWLLVSNSIHTLLCMFTHHKLAISFVSRFLFNSVLFNFMMILCIVWSVEMWASCFVLSSINVSICNTSTHLSFSLLHIPYWTCGIPFGKINSVEKLNLMTFEFYWLPDAAFTSLGSCVCYV